MTYFKPGKMILAYRPGSDKALYNLLKYSPIPIESVFLADYPLSAEEKRRYYALHPDLIFTENLEQALQGEADTLLWTREVFETKADYDWWHKVLWQAAEHGKHIYNLARLVRVQDDEALLNHVTAKGVKYWNASNHALDMGEVEPYGEMLPSRTKAVVISVVGTERRCGKFTTTQVIRARLRHAGLTIAEIATEPYGLLTGASYVIIPQVFPMWKATPAVRKIVRHLDETMQPDVILVSSQSGIRATALDAAGRCGGVVAYTIALGAVPDACVLCSSFKSVPLVPEERHFVEFLLQRPVIGVAVKCKDIEPSVSKNVIHRLKQELKLPVFDPICNPDTTQELIETITKMVG